MNSAKRYESVAPELRIVLLKLSRNLLATDLAKRALRGLAGFAKALKFKFGDIEVGLDLREQSVPATSSPPRRATIGLFQMLAEMRKHPDGIALNLAMFAAAQPGSSR